MKRPFAVVTDSTADLPDEWRERYGIEVVPLKVLFGSETFRDRVDMTDAQFFERLAARVAERSRRYVASKLSVEAMLFDFEGNTLGRANAPA